MYRLCLVFLAWIPAALAQPASLHDLTNTSSSLPTPGAEFQPAQDRAWTYALTGTLLPVGAGIALLAADPTTGDGDVVVGSLLIGSGLLVGPSLGHFYLGDGRRAWLGIGLRSAAVGVGALISATTRQGELDFVPIGGFLVAVVGVAAGATYSFATLDDSVRERRVTVGPGVGPNGAPLLTVSARF